MSDSIRPVNRPARGWWVAVGCTLAWLIGLVWSLAAMQIDRTKTVEAGTVNLRHLWPYWMASAGIWIGLSALWMMLIGEPSRGVRDFRRLAAFILLISIGARAAVLITHEPGLSDDAYRYIFDGRNLAAGFNPYLVLPADRLNAADESWPGERQLVPLITYPELATPYLPVSQCVFGVIGTTIGKSSSNPESSARAFRVGFTVIEIILIVLIFAALKHAGRSPWWAALYAWHPLPISEIAGSGHQDVIGITFLVASLLAFSIAVQKTWRWTTLLGLSALGKPFTIPAGAIMLRGRPFRQWIKSAAIGVLVLAIAFAPFWLIWGDHGRAYHHWKHTADVLAEKFAHFGGVYEPVLSIVREVMPADGKPEGFNLKQEWLARKMCLGMFAIAGLAIFLNHRLTVWQATRAFLFALVLFTTTAHPWYLLWAFALVPMSNSWAMWVLSLTLPWGYMVLGDVVNWKVQSWVYAAAYVPVLVALAADVVIHSRSRRLAAPQAASHL